jgi:hypothetical protein
VEETFCKEHSGCPMSGQICPVDWVIQRLKGRRIKDIIPPGQKHRFGLIFEGGAAILDVFTYLPTGDDPDAILTYLEGLSVQDIRFYPPLSGDGWHETGRGILQLRLAHPNRLEDETRFGVDVESVLGLIDGEKLDNACPD